MSYGLQSPAVCALVPLRGRADNGLAPAVSHAGARVVLHLVHGPIDHPPCVTHEHC